MNHKYTFMLFKRRQSFKTYKLFHIFWLLGLSFENKMGNFPYYAFLDKLVNNLADKLFDRMMNADSKELSCSKDVRQCINALSCQHWIE